MWVNDKLITRADKAVYEVSRKEEAEENAKDEEEEVVRGGEAKTAHDLQMCVFIRKHQM